MPTTNTAPAQNAVLVLGANGRLGRATVEAFAAAGWQVLAQARKHRAGRCRAACVRCRQCVTCGNARSSSTRAGCAP